MTANLVALWYLVASVCFILALKGLSSPETARRGNAFGIAGMVIAVVTTIAIVAKGHLDFILVAMVIGGTIGTIVSRRVQMTQMPELVAAMHSLVGMAAVLIAVAVVNNPAAFGEHDPLPLGNRLELFIGSFVGAITFSGSVIAFGKLAGLGKKFRLFSSAPVVFKGQHALNLILALAMIGFGTAFFLADGKAWVPFLVMLGIAFALGLLIIIPDRRGRHAGGDQHAQQLLGLGGRGDRLLAQQHHAHRRRKPRRLLGRDPLLHHVQGDEPLVHLGDHGRLRRGRRQPQQPTAARRPCARVRPTMPRSSWRTRSRW